MGRLSRTKGKVWERAVAAMFRDAMPSAAGSIKRGWQARSGKDAADVVVPVFHVECKHGIKPNPRAALEQAVNDASAGMVPVAVIKDNHGEPFVVFRAADFFDFVREWWATR